MMIQPIGFDKCLSFIEQSQLRELGIGYVDVHLLAFLSPRRHKATKQNPGVLMTVWQL